MNTTDNYLNSQPGDPFSNFSSTNLPNMKDRKSRVSISGGSGGSNYIHSRGVSFESSIPLDSPVKSSFQERVDKLKEEEEEEEVVEQK